MSLFASLNIVLCPRCGASVLAGDICHSKAEAELSTAKCTDCGLELQIADDKVSGKTRVERVKRN